MSSSQRLKNAMVWRGDASIRAGVSAIEFPAWLSGKSCAGVDFLLLLEDRRPSAVSPLFYSLNVRGPLAYIHLTSETQIPDTGPQMYVSTQHV